MPTYEYECEACGLRFERFQHMTDPPVRTCPTCGNSVRRLISAGGGFIFKGSGFYATDHGGDSQKTASCDRSSPCCGRAVPCEKSPRNK